MAGKYYPVTDDLSLSVKVICGALRTAIDTEADLMQLHRSVAGEDQIVDIRVGYAQDHKLMGDYIFVELIGELIVVYSPGEVLTYTWYQIDEMCQAVKQSLAEVVECNITLHNDFVI